jgi:predicted acetyltransferase
MSIGLEQTTVDDAPNLIDSVAEDEASIFDRDRRGGPRKELAVEVGEHVVAAVGGFEWKVIVAAESRTGTRRRLIVLSIDMDPTETEQPMQLVWPAAPYLPSYVRALERGWSPDNLRPDAGREELDEIARDPARFIAEQVDLEANGPPVTLPDGSTAPRLPGFHKWMWDGEFCGSIGFRWQPGTTALPPYCLGHIGYSVVPWKRGNGYATTALRLLLSDARARGLAFVELTTDADNIASQRVIEANGGTLFERFNKPPGYGGAPSLRFRIALE